ncbi:MAG: serine protease [Bradyrhizobium sp.]
MKNSDRSLFAGVCIGACLSITAVQAAPVDIDRTIVSVRCAAGSGSGVVVSAVGEVVTALHVVKDGAGCFGTLGYASPSGGVPLVLQQQNKDFDVALLRFTEPRTYAFAKACRLEDWMVRSSIFATGYPGGTTTGVPSYRKGVLSTVFPNPKGVLETDGQTVAGMSGGPIFSSDLRALIGIVVGAQFAAGGGVDYYGILPFERIRGQFGLAVADAPCYRKSREVVLPEAVNSWKPRRDGDPLSTDVRLGVRPEDGFCFITGIIGQMNDPKDSIEIAIDNGEYVLTGNNVSGSAHSGKVRCVWFE